MKNGASTSAGRPCSPLASGTRVTVVAKQGEGISLYLDGKLATEKKETGARAPNDEPLYIGREAWGADPANSENPGFFIGSLDDLKIWTRALTANEVSGSPAH